jgi:CDP-ribitol ribitolphosphotransferase / teichoic acid ribitol-phosphate polymerase
MAWYAHKKIGYLMAEDALTERDYLFLSKVSHKTDYFVVPSLFYASVLASAFNVNIKKMLLLGMPRIDDLSSKNNLKIMNKMISKDVSKYSKILIYVPTFRNGLGRETDGFMSSTNLINIEEYEELKLMNYLKENNYLLIVKYHPSEQSKTLQIEFDNIVYLNDDELFKNDISLNNFLLLSDILITDYSSVYIDYLALNKPIIFTNFDCNEFKQNRGFIFNDSNFWFCGPTVSKIDDFVFESKKLLNDKNYFQIERDNFKNLVLTNYVESCKRVCDYIFEKKRLSSLKVKAIKYKDRI